MHQSIYFFLFVIILFVFSAQATMLVFDWTFKFYVFEIFLWE